jgi:hypothetical protein
VQGSTFVFSINTSAKNPTQCKAPKRYRASLTDKLPLNFLPDFVISNK